jgi:hypothetical protein
MSRLEELLADAELALDTAKNGRGPNFRHDAAVWLKSLATEMEGLLRAAKEDAQNSNAGGAE